MVRDQVREVTRRVAGSGVSGTFDFFTRGAAPPAEATGFLTDELFGPEAYYEALVAGRPHGADVDTDEPAPAAPEVDDIEADRIADPVATTRDDAPAPAPVEHRGRGVRFATAESDAARARGPQPKPLPVDLTAHDDTEEMPRIDIRKHA
jgi:hypothetical protein